MLALLKNKITWLVLALLIVSGLVTYTISWYDEKINEAFEAGKKDVVSAQNEFSAEQYKRQLEDNKIKINNLNNTIKKQKEKSNKLEKMLLIDHDLDRLLQAKPNLILTRVNKGTREAIDNLESITDEDYFINSDSSN